MTIRVLISFFSDDRPGVIEDLSAVVGNCGGNWLDSQLSRLGGRFAGVLQAQVPKVEQERMTRELAALSDKAITATMTTAGEAPAAVSACRNITVLGPDRPGIVYEMTKALHAGGFNVASMSTAVETAPMSGEPIFRAEARIEVHEGSRLDELESQLDAMAEAMTLEIDIVDA